MRTRFHAMVNKKSYIFYFIFFIRTYFYNTINTN